jgi:hypothetical protein
VEGPVGNEGFRAVKSRSNTGGDRVGGLHGKTLDLVPFGLPCRLHIAAVIAFPSDCVIKKVAEHLLVVLSCSI